MQCGQTLRGGSTVPPVRCIALRCIAVVQVQVCSQPGLAQGSSRSSIDESAARCSLHMRLGGGWPNACICSWAVHDQVLGQPSIMHGTWRSSRWLNSPAARACHGAAASLGAASGAGPSEVGATSAAGEPSPARASGPLPLRRPRRRLRLRRGPSEASPPSAPPRGSASCSLFRSPSTRCSLRRPSTRTASPTTGEAVSPHDFAA